MKTARMLCAVVVVLSCVVVLAGCTPAAPRFVDDGRQLSADQALELPMDLNPGAVAGRSTSEAEELRARSLAAMRRNGGVQAEVAGIITASLPAKGRGVPFYVELADVDSVPSIVIVEATGPKNGKLSDQRVWVLERGSGKVLLMGMR